MCACLHVSSRHDFNSFANSFVDSYDSVRTLGHIIVLMLYLRDVVLYTYKRGMGKSYYASPHKINAIYYFQDLDPGHDSGWSIALIR